MQRLARGFMLVSAMLGGIGSALSAQTADDGGGLGAFLDWLHRLSGPRFVGGGLSGFLTLPGDAGIRLRLSGAYRTSVSEEGEVVPADANITMITIQPAVEFPLRNLPLDFSLGVGLHRFGGDAEGFWHYSVPIGLQYRPALGGRLAPRIGMALNVFPEFEASDFDPLTVTVSRDDAEAVLQVFIGLDFRLRGR
jgi:hypothetical protein